MALLELKKKELTDLARTYGNVYQTDIGKVAYTKLVNPEGFVLIAQDDQLRFYLYQKPGGVWEYIWGASSIVHDGLPTSEELIQWRLKHALRAGKQGLDEAAALSGALLGEAAEAGTEVHRAAESLLNGEEVSLIGRAQKQTWAIGSLANFIVDHTFRNWQTEQIVVYDQMTGCGHQYKPHNKMAKCNGQRVVYAGTVDLVIEIWNQEKKKFETWLIDYKTSADVHKSHKLQCLGYKGAMELSRGLKIDRVGVLLLGKATQKGYLLSEVGKERNYRLTFDDYLLTYKMVMMINGGKLPPPNYKTFPKSIKINQEEDKEDGKNTNSNSGASSSSGPVARISTKGAPKKSARGVGAVRKGSSGATETAGDPSPTKPAAKIIGKPKTSKSRSRSGQGVKNDQKPARVSPKVHQASPEPASTESPGSDIRQHERATSEVRDLPASPGQKDQESKVDRQSGPSLPSPSQGPEVKMDMTGKVFLKEWYTLGKKIYGNVYNHGRLVDGVPLNGSEIRKSYEEDDGSGGQIRVVLTRNTKYYLFKEYERKLDNG